MSNQPKSPPDTPTFAELAADPAIAPLLDFEPVPLRRRANGWDADAQRAFIAHLAITGSKTHAADAVGRAPNGADQLLKRDGANSFRDAHDRALAFFRRHHQQQLADGVAAACRADPALQAPGQLLNEAGEYEDRDSLDRRAEDARDSISAKLQRARRLYLREISGCAGKRAAFEILTELPVDWDAAARLEPQPDEPWRKPTMRAPDMLLTAESGWMGDFTHGPNRMAEARQALNDYRAEHGLDPIDWDEESEGTKT